MNRHSDCPPLADLAAFIDGQLGDQDRATIRRHLDGCESCYEVFTETVQTNDEIAANAAPGTTGTPNAPTPRRPRSRWLGPTAGLAVAAGLVWAMIGGPLRGVIFGGGLAPTSEILRSVDPEALSRAMDDPTWDLHGWPTTRGAEQFVVPDDLAFRVGVRLVDYEAAHVAGADSATARDRLLLQLRKVDLSQALVAAYEALPEFAGARGRVELEGAVLAHLDSPYAQLGRWAEVVRLAATTGDARLTASLGRAPTVIAPSVAVATAYSALQTELAGDAPDAQQVARLAAELIATAGGA